MFKQHIVVTSTYSTLHTAQKHSTALSTADTLNYCVIYYTNKLPILHRAIEIPADQYIYNIPTSTDGPWDPLFVLALQYPIPS